MRKVQQVYVATMITLLDNSHIYHYTGRFIRNGFGISNYKSRNEVPMKANTGEYTPPPRRSRLANAAASNAGEIATVA
jgi:hypothetical protein